MQQYSEALRHPGKHTLTHLAIEIQSSGRNPGSQLFAGITLLHFTGLGYYTLKSLKASQKTLGKP